MFSPFQRVSLKVKFLVMIGSALGLTLYITFLAVSHYMTESLTKEATLRALAIAKGIAQYSGEAILTKDRLAMETMLAEAIKDPSILYVFILDNKQHVLAHSDLSEQGKVYFDSTQKGAKPSTGEVQVITSSDSKGAERLDVVTPILFSRKTVIGSLHLGFSKKLINEMVIQSQKKIELIMSVSLFVGLLGALWLAHFIVKPIHSLAEGVKAITRGEYKQIETRSHDEIGYLISTFNDMSRNLYEKELIKNAFSQYVSQGILETYLKNPKAIQIGGARAEATILFTDIRNFTALSEQLDPSSVVQILNEYFEIVIEVVQKYEGTLDKFIGDAVMAVFGVPLSHPNDEERAVRAAIEMNKRFEPLKEAWRAEFRQRIDIGIGINTGEVIAGNVGSMKKLAYTVIGDSVNMAARIEKLNKRFHTEILISQSTYKNLTEILEVTPLPPTRVRGKSEEIQVYSVVGFRDSKSPAPRKVAILNKSV